jgi:hypothetical protein
MKMFQVKLILQPLLHLVKIIKKNILLQLVVFQTHNSFLR